MASVVHQVRARPQPPRWVAPLLVGLLALPVILPVASGQDAGTVDLNFSRVEIVVWGNGTRFSEFHVDTLAGDALNVSVLMQASRNRLTEPIDVLVRASFLDPGLANVTAQAVQTVTPDDRRIPLAPLNLSLPADVVDGSYTMRLELDAGHAESNPVSNVVDVPVEVGVRTHAEEAYRFQAAFLIGAGVVILLVAGAAALTRAGATEAGRRARQVRVARWERLVEWWNHHPRHTTLKAIATGGAVTFLVVILAWSGFLVVPEREILVRRIVIGLMVGAIYALVAVGYTMVYGVLKFINFAHGEMLMWGAYAAFAITVMWGQSFVLAVLGAVLFAAVLGASIERVAYRPLRGSARLTPLITAIGVSLFLQGTAQFFFTTNTQVYKEATDRTMIGGRSMTEFLDGAVFTLFGVPVQMIGVVILVASIVLMLGLHLFIRRTRLGKAMRAVSDDFDTAAVIGIHVNRVVMMTFVIGSALAAVAGILVGLRLSLTPTMGFVPGIKAFTAAVVGGIGNIYGAFLGGFLIGLAENVGGAFLEERAFQEAIAFLVLIIFLIVRPTGIFAARESEVRKK